jgi:L,D-transpeptidase ErfK/SrfK
LLRTFAPLAFVLLPSFPADAQQLPPLSSLVVGGQFTYTAQKGDSLTSVGARFGMEARVLAKYNGLQPYARLKQGQVLRLVNRHIVPQRLDDGMVINIPQRVLFFFKSGQLVRTYPVAVGRPDWPTLIGNFPVLGKEEDKVWYVPKSIREEMQRQGKSVEEKVPPGSKNPLGKYWIRITPSCGIHGTIYPASIYTFQTHGCIRLHPDDVADLWARVPVGTAVKIVYEPVLLAQVEDGSIYLEAHGDVYKRGGHPLRTVQLIARAAEVSSRVDWQEIKQVLQKREGLARPVGLGRTEPSE